MSVFKQKFEMRERNSTGTSDTMTWAITDLTAIGFTFEIYLLKLGLFPKPLIYFLLELINILVCQILGKPNKMYKSYSENRTS